MGCGVSKDVSYTQIDQSIWKGKLKIWLLKATLRKDNLLFGKQSPYVKFIFGRQKKQSTVCENGGKFPEWHKESFEFIRTSEEDIVYVQIWSKNMLTDTFIGEGGFALTKIRQGTNGDKIDQSFLIYGKSEEIGEVFIQLEFQLDEQSKNHPEILAPDQRGQVIVRPHKASLLRDLGGLFSTQTPLACVRLAEESQVTSVCDGQSKNPTWTDSLIFNREKTKDTFVIEVQNFNDSGKNQLIGVGFFSITAALPYKSIAKKTVDLYYEGNLVGNIQVQLEFIPADPALYQQNQQKQQPQQQAQSQQQPQQQQQQSQVTQPIPVNTQKLPEQQQQLPINPLVQVQQQPVQQQIQQQPLATYSNQIYQPSPNQQLFNANQEQMLIPTVITPIQYPQKPLSGQGSFTFPNGDSYEGEWQNSLRHGYGKCRFITGMEYIGQWLNDMFHGQGKLVFGNTVYNGQFANGKKNGQGTMTWVGSLQKYEGNWVDNNQHGEGVWTFPNGQSKKAEFYKGQRVKWLDEQQFGMKSGSFISQGQMLPSPNGLFTLLLNYNGAIQVMNNQNQQLVFQIAMFNRQIFQPFYLKLEHTGELVGLDATQQPYFRTAQCQGQSPFRLLMNDDGRATINDATNRICLYLN